MVMLQQRYKKEAIPALQKEFGYKNILAVPRIVKVVVSSGVGRLHDNKDLEVVQKALALITGQKPAGRPTRQAIAAFKTRAGQLVGYQVTLRGSRMWDFLDRLVHVVIPRSRDFRGIDLSAFDRRGNLTLGFREHLIFPELSSEDIRFLFGLAVSVVSTARSRQEGISLLRALGFPLKTAQAAAAKK